MNNFLRLRFKNLSFEDKESRIRFHFLRIFYFDINQNELDSIGRFKVNSNSITFFNQSEESVRHKFNLILIKGFNNLTNKLNGNKTIYIHKNSGIPLIGTLAFGIVDKGSNMLEIKPITGCNLNCIFCSVDEGPSSKKDIDFVVEKDYLVEELKKLIDYKLAFDKEIRFEIYINPHGEPLLYSEIVELVKDISKLSNIKVISIITNGTLLDRALIDKLIKAGLSQLNISLNALSSSMARELANNEQYNLNKITKLVKYLSNRIKVIIAPVLLHGINNNEMGKIARFAKENKAKILIQKFIPNKRGRNPIKEQSWEAFFILLKELGERENIQLVHGLDIMKTKELPVPFKKGDIIKAEIICKGRYHNERIATAKERSIIVIVKGDYKSANKVGILLKIRIIKSIHNIIVAKEI